MTARTTTAFGIHSLPSEPATRSVEPVDGRRGRLQDQSAQPAHTNDIASVTTMSATRVKTTTLPLIAPRTMPRIRTPTTTRDADLLALALHQRRGDDVRDAIIAPIDRSMPPEITTIAWATAASASGRTAIARPWMPVAP